VLTGSAASAANAGASESEKLLSPGPSTALSIEHTEQLQVRSGRYGDFACRSLAAPQFA
jgi:hypothetical protein